MNRARVMYLWGIQSGVRWQSPVCPASAAMRAARETSYGVLAVVLGRCVWGFLAARLLVEWKPSVSR